MRLILVYLHGNHIVTFFSPGDYASYGAVLAVTKSELKEFETMTHITISRFFRDGPVWQYLLSTVNSHQFSSIRINSHQFASILIKSRLISSDFSVLWASFFSAFFLAQLGASSTSEFGIRGWWALEGVGHGIFKRRRGLFAQSCLGSGDDAPQRASAPDGDCSE